MKIKIERHAYISRYPHDITRAIKTVVEKKKVALLRHLQKKNKNKNGNSVNFYGYAVNLTLVILYLPHTDILCT